MIGFPWANTSAPGDNMKSQNVFLSRSSLQVGPTCGMWAKPPAPVPKGVVIDFLGLLGHRKKLKNLTLGGLNAGWATSEHCLAYLGKD